MLAEDEVEVMVINEKKREKRQGHGSSMQGQKQTAETRVQITGYSLSLFHSVHEDLLVKLYVECTRTENG